VSCTGAFCRSVCCANLGWRGCLWRCRRRRAKRLGKAKEVLEGRAAECDRRVAKMVLHCVCVHTRRIARYLLERVAAALRQVQPNPDVARGKVVVRFGWSEAEFEAVSVSAPRSDDIGEDGGEVGGREDGGTVDVVASCDTDAGVFLAARLMAAFGHAAAADVDKVWRATLCLSRPDGDWLRVLSHCSDCRSCFDVCRLAGRARTGSGGRVAAGAAIRATFSRHSPFWRFRGRHSRSHSVWRLWAATTLTSSVVRHLRSFFRRCGFCAPCWRVVDCR
jgi:hypothetical protein